MNTDNATPDPVPAAQRDAWDIDAEMARQVAEQERRSDEFLGRRLRERELAATALAWAA